MEPKQEEAIETVYREFLSSQMEEFLYYAQIPIVGPMLYKMKKILYDKQK